ncbi:MAG: hypothetical protein SZ59_C0001G0098 [candidate division TM6 bacterium GW2011_GWF2_28_16]|nr:MAG: hypothetical protein SZ59_C0001G0098 [candidate division TM6 bacterium GW2011_GWF2_28_16]
MNNTIKSIIASTFLFASINAGIETQKTYLQTRPFLSNLPMELTTWHTQINKMKHKKWGGSFQAVPFYQESQNEYDLGKYFGYHANTVNEDRDYINVSEAVYDNIDPRNVIHNSADSAALKATGKFFLEPKQKTFGVRLDYNHNFKRFYARISTPITSVKSGINPKTAGTLTNITAGEGAGQNIMDYFNGDFQETTVGSTNLQDKLLYAKIGGNHDKTNFGDVKLALGYNFYKHKSNFFKLGLDFTIPTGNDAKAEWLFEPINGNGGYWALGAAFDSRFRLAKNAHRKIHFMLAGHAEYLFENTEKRVVGLKDYITGHPKLRLAHYMLAGEDAKYALFPAANILAQDLKIKPGFQLEGLAGFSVTAKNVVFDIGYNIYYKEKENVKQKNAWEDNKYALADTDFDSTVQFDPAANYVNGASGAINSANIDLDAATSPSALTNKVYAGFGYCFNECKTPLMLAVGTSYEFVNGNEALENFEIYGKLGISF